ncbi:hypothetical protein DIS24_g6219 [Lasiodiplodia hormozganensis]|uniref:Uncharacterized protein n=1 Tax=Lasiodiplodia hormozganensis TaxID=869390 RepID=A0AA39YLK4_9PEZI|nr:hypothetical protein DIS24_g6219 [Lasiodiplodia hormozganensis]
MSSAPDTPITIKTRSGRLLDSSAVEEIVDRGLARRERELTSHRARAKASAARLVEKALGVRCLAKKILAGLKR